MLQRPEGATVAEMVEATGWLAHTVRGCIAGALKKKLGLPITAAMRSVAFTDAPVRSQTQPLFTVKATSGRFGRRRRR